MAPPPDDLTIPQFILDSQHPLRQLRTDEFNKAPWLIEDETGKNYTLEEVRARTFGLANAVAKRWGIGDDDVVCVYSPNNIDYPTVIWAIHRLGAIASCANPAYTESELPCLQIGLAAARASGLSANRVVLMAPQSSSPTASKTVQPTVEELVQEGLSLPLPPAFVEKRLTQGENQRKIAFLSFSSGTTGKPKAVAIPHYSVIANILQFASFNRNNDPTIPWEDRRFRPGDVATAVLPFFHIYGLVINLHVSLFCGLSLVVFSKFSWIDFLKSIVRYKITHLFIVPPQVVLFAKHPETKKYDLSSLRYCMAGAAPLSPELTEQFRKVVPKSTVVTMPPIEQRHGGTLGSAGQLVSGTEAKVVKSDGTLAKYGEMGELFIRGPQGRFNRYYNNPAANAETFVDGWVRTGDEVYFHENGDMFIELIKCRGFQVAPAELEGHLLDHPDVNDVCVVGVQDDYSGEVPLAFVVLTSSASSRAAKASKEAEEIKASIRKHVSEVKVRYKWLDGGVEFVDIIPKNPSGKLLRRFLREKAKEIRARRGPSHEAVASKVRARL
ncbi:hypothetical protein FS837_010626 [Tulasnella sp. UAMH 9824]|nr:hypothetical protein FS837_010626 [Tulasnella sp. UAMH 9824]